MKIAIALFVGLFLGLVIRGLAAWIGLFFSSNPILRIRKRLAVRMHRMSERLCHPEPPVTVSISAVKRDDQKKAWVELKKLEYTTAAQRYDNIYKAVWQNFSYMAVLSAAILTFGVKTLAFPVLIAVALIPLVFWFLAQFLPMDQYGESTRERLSVIEDQINHQFFPNGGDPEFSHFTYFKNQRTGLQLKAFWSVKHIIYIAGFFVIWGLYTFGAQALTLKDFRIAADSTGIITTIGADSATVSLHPRGMAITDSIVKRTSLRVDRLDSLLSTTNAKLDSLALNVRGLQK
jgi:hypothetical protein